MTDQERNQPLGGNEMGRFGGPATDLLYELLCVLPGVEYRGGASG